MKKNEEKCKSAANPSNAYMALLPGNSPKPLPLSDGNTSNIDYRPVKAIFFDWSSVWKAPEC